MISDLHAVCNIDNEYSFLQYNNDGNSPFENSFLQFLEKEGFEDIDFILCAGDIGTAGNSEEFSKGWSFLNKSKGALNVSDLYAVPGNHDHQSRPDMSFDPKHHLQFIEPPFPVSCHQTNTNFWAWHWCHVETDLYNIILVNSSAYHGMNKEFEHGRVSEEVVDQISNYLKSDSFPKRKINICLCHHHPLPMSYVDGKADREVMVAGDLLINAIEYSGKGPWLFVHGHKHFPNISNRQEDGAKSVTILSAGSFSAKLHEEILDRTSNQFYIMDIDIDKTEENNRLFGRFSTYEYSVSHGWRPSTSENLPAYGGFGNVSDAESLARDFSSKLDSNIPYLDANDIENIYPEIFFLRPMTLIQFTEELEKLGVNTEIDRGKLISAGKV